MELKSLSILGELFVAFGKNFVCMWPLQTRETHYYQVGLHSTTIFFLLQKWWTSGQALWGVFVFHKSKFEP